ncbi:MAG: Rrf2 family transcriptional regulator [Planctomycetes bacterium]|nr:Rrf2 family transcriptional regulator [Planctomycetota bacterium]
MKAHMHDHRPRPGSETVRLNKSTQYALQSMLELSRAGGEPRTACEIAARHDVPETVLAKVLQQLVRAGLVRASRGVGGGYRLARPPAQISVQDVIDLFEPPPPHEPSPWDHRLPVETDEPRDRLRDLFYEVDETVRATFRSVTFDTLVR